jgi:hypothetical protein
MAKYEQKRQNPRGISNAIYWFLFCSFTAAKCGVLAVALKLAGG